ncbi:tetratricopeptide repeat protein [Croceicoccus sp. Ery15]|uniref:tetratricopeptide repeat protein n=1 Tax=Croceicoccus sp. Ery15 TaxID=1703338 RepID=UPI001E41533C|nr:tetratricopeptide repeat protein [Croceicoccus sp. Ery15]
MNAAALPPQQWHQRAIAAERGGDPTGAAAIYRAALEQHPDHADLLNSAGNLHMRLGDPATAAELFGKALAARPGTLAMAVNRALALTQADRAEEAAELLAGFAQQGANDARFHSTRANALRSADRLDEAAAAYDRALAIDPARAIALHGRARIALERAESDAAARFDRALQAHNADPNAWLGKAQAMEAAGDAAGARAIAEQLVVQAPAWHDGLRFLAQLRLAAGETDFTSHLADAERRLPQDASIAFLHGELLAGIDRNAEAAEVVHTARQRLPDAPRLTLLEAIYAGAAGDDDRAETLFATLSTDSFEHRLHEARHRIRRGEYDRADDLLASALDAQPWDIGAWALRGIVWRLTGDTRAKWLHEQAGLFALRPLEGDPQVLADAARVLHGLHDRSVFPLGQSLRGGTQTRGRLFHRMEPELRRLSDAIRATLDVHRTGLPPQDDTHPLLRWRNARWRIEGSWSVRLHGGGDHHTGHIHPQGILSSALYIDLPDVAGDGEEALLELGRPPADLRLDLEPLAVFRPKAGHLALFPSTLYHGTTPFAAGRRMTVAFDVTSH